MLANPLPGVIQARGETWKGAPNFIVTSTFAEHVASGRGAGIDIGNGRCGFPVYAMAAGAVTLSGYLGAALVVRVNHPGLSGSFGGLSVESGYAHLASSLVHVGQAVTKGQQIGTHGMTGADACHLHGGLKIGGVERDWWPLLDQNAPPQPSAGGDMLQGSNPKQINNKVATVLGDNTRFRAAPGVGTTPVLAVYGTGTTFTPDWEVTGAAVGTNAQWYGGWGKTAKGLEFGYFHSSTLSPLQPFESGGHTPAELQAANVAGYNEGRSKVQGAAAAVPPK